MAHEDPEDGAWPVPNGVGRAEGAAEDDPPLSEYIANLLVPDVEQRWGWRDYWVKRQPAPKPGRRAGFVRD